MSEKVYKVIGQEHCLSDIGQDQFTLVQAESHIMKSSWGWLWDDIIFVSGQHLVDADTGEIYAERII